MAAFAFTDQTRVLQALAWEHWRRGWWRLLNAQVAVLGVAIVVYSSLQQIGPVDPTSTRTLHMLFLSSVLVATGGAASMIRGDSSRYFWLPLSNTSVSLIILLPGMLAIAIGWVATAAIMNWQFQTKWPWLGPAIYMAAFWGAIQTGLHIVGSNRLGRFIVWSTIPIGLGGWLCWRYQGNSLLNPRVMWVNVTLSDVLTLGSLILLEFLLLPRCIARERCGEGGLLKLSWGCSSPALSGGTSREVVTQRLFSSAAQAQFWFEWRQKGWLLPSTLAVFILFLVAGYACGMYGNYELLHSGIGYGIGLVPFSIVMGLVLGHADLQKRQVECSSFQGTLPMTNWQLSRALLKVQALSLLLTWGAWCGWLAVATAILFTTDGSAPVWDLWTDHKKFEAEYGLLGNAFALVLLGMELLLAWIGLSLASAVVLTGRRNWLIALLSGSIPMFVLAMAAASTLEQGNQLVSPAFYLCAAGLLAILLSVPIIGKATSGNAIPSQTAWLLVIIAAIGASVIGALMSQLRWDSAPLVLFMLGLVFLAVTPWAAAPLALSLNRHR